MSRIIFTGSRNLGSDWLPTVTKAVVSVLKQGHHIGVGDAKGLDSMVRSACEDPGHVFEPFDVQGLREARSLVLRSMEMVNWAAEDHGTCLAFVNTPCPKGIEPAGGWMSPTYGKGSGTWSTLAYAIGIGLEVFVRRCGVKASEMPMWPGGTWVISGEGGDWVNWLRWRRETRPVVADSGSLEPVAVRSVSLPRPTMRSYAIVGVGARLPWWAGWLSAWRTIVWTMWALIRGSARTLFQLEIG